MAEIDKYVHGSTARVYTAEPIRRSAPEHEKRRRVKKQPKKKVDKVAVVVTIITMSVAFFVCFTYLQKQFEVTQLGNDLVLLENEVVELEKQNTELSEQVEASVDLKEIFKKATKELGMVHAKDNQVFTYVSQKGDQVKQYGNIPAN